MQRAWAWKTLRWVVAGMLLLVLLTVAAVIVRWMMVAGPKAGLIALKRLVQHGTTTIDDFKLYPARRLHASNTPYHFDQDANGVPPPQEIMLTDGSLQSLEEVLLASDTIAFLMIKEDAIVFERYYQGHTPTSLSQIFSVSKSIFSVLVGMAIDDGFIRSVDQPVIEWVPELAGRGFDSVTLKHLLTMTSGMAYMENDNPFGLHVPLNYTSDLEKMILEFRAHEAYRGKFEYKSGDTALLTLVLQRALAPKAITEYAQERLWTPLGMESKGIWTVDQDEGLEKSWCCLAATARDLAKIGRLYREGGRWEGRQLLSPQWIEASTRQGAIDMSAWPADFAAIGLWNYGYYWWLASPDEGDYLALGKDGQYLYVNPLRQVIIVRLGRSSGGLRTGQWLSIFTTLAREIK